MTVRHTITRAIMPAPPDLNVWIVWSDGSLEGPHRVLYTSFPVHTYEFQSEVKTSPTQAWLNPSDELEAAERDDEYALTEQIAMFYVDCGIDDGAGMWLEHGKTAFTSQARAEAMAKRRQDAKTR